MESDCQWISFGGDENVKLIVVLMAQLCEYTKKHWIVYFKWVNSIVCDYISLKPLYIKMKQNKNLTLDLGSQLGLPLKNTWGDFSNPDA